MAVTTSATKNKQTNKQQQHTHILTKHLALRNVIYLCVRPDRLVAEYYLRYLLSGIIYTIQKLETCTENGKSDFRKIGMEAFFSAIIS